MSLGHFLIHILEVFGFYAKKATDSQRKNGKKTMKKW